MCESNQTNPIGKTNEESTDMGQDFEELLYKDVKNILSENDAETFDLEQKFMSKCNIENDEKITQTEKNFLIDQSSTGAHHK